MLATVLEYLLMLGAVIAAGAIATVALCGLLVCLAGWKWRR